MKLKWPINDWADLFGIPVRVTSKKDTICPVNIFKFQCDFLLLMDVEEWINNEYAECVFLHPQES